MIIKINKNILWFGLIGLVLIVGITITIISNPGGNKVSSSGSATVNTVSSSTIISDGSGSLAINSTPSRQQTASMGAVTVDVEPKVLSTTAETNIFSVAFNTHSVELDFDFIEIIALEDDLGNKYEALEWTGNSGWHHVSGDIIFPEIDEGSKKVVMQISAIEGKAQIFEWSVN